MRWVGRRLRGRLSTGRQVSGLGRISNRSWRWPELLALVSCIAPCRGSCALCRFGT